jgi:hypothetical protein
MKKELGLEAPGDLHRYMPESSKSPNFMPSFGYRLKLVWFLLTELDYT